MNIIFRQSGMDTLKFHITQRSKGTDTSDLLFLKSDKGKINSGRFLINLTLLYTREKNSTNIRSQSW